MTDITLPVIPPVLRNVQDLHNLTRIVGQVCNSGSAISAPGIVPGYFWCVCSRISFLNVQRSGEPCFTWYSQEREVLKEWFCDYWYPLHAAAVSGDDIAYAAAEFRLAERYGDQWTLLQAAWMMPEPDGKAAERAWGYAHSVLGELGSLARFREKVISGVPVTLTRDTRRLENMLAVAINEPEKAAMAQPAWCEQMFTDGLLSVNDDFLPAGWPQALVHRFAPVIIGLGRLLVSRVTTPRGLTEFQPVFSANSSVISDQQCCQWQHFRPVTSTRKCVGCGNTSPEYVTTCPHCGAEKCHACDMGDDTCCLHCEGGVL